MKPRIVTLKEKKLIGIRLKMSVNDDRTHELWSKFMPRKKEITNNISKDLISMQVYEPSYFRSFQPSKEFEKWSTVEVSSFDKIPSDMESYILEEGVYAVFDHKGSSDDKRIFQHIFGVWLPNSPYDIDDRPHFEVLGEKYKNNDVNSEEEIWIPIKSRHIETND